MTIREGNSMGSRSARAHRVRSGFGGRQGLVRLDRNEDPSGWPPELVADLTKRITPETLAAYPDPSPLTASIAQWTGRSVDEVLVTSGSTEGLRLVFETFGDEGRSVVRLDPTYSLYELYECIEGLQSVKVTYPLDLSPPVDELIQSIAAVKPSLVILANPDQPTGVSTGFGGLRRIAEVTAHTGSVLAFDEAYFMFGAESAEPLHNHFSHVVVIRTFSKAFGLAGLRIGYILSSAPMIDRLRRLEPAVPPSSISLTGGLWAIDHLDEARARVGRVIDGRRYLQERLLESGVRFVPSLGNFVLVAAKTTELAESTVTDARDKGYAIKGPIDVPPTGPSVRITVGPLSLMEEFWNKCRDILLRLAHH